MIGYSNISEGCWGLHQCGYKSIIHYPRKLNDVLR